MRIHPSGTKAFIVNYRAGDGGRKAPNKRVVIGRYGTVSPDQARPMAQELLGQVAGGDDPAEARAEALSMPTIGDAFEDYMVSVRVPGDEEMVIRLLACLPAPGRAGG